MCDPCEMFKALSVETRLRIFEMLKEKGPLGAKTIASRIGITPAAVSQHLKILKQAGLVRNERRGYWIPYSVNEDVLERCRCMMNDVCSCAHDGHHGRRERKASLEDNLKALLEYEKRIEDELEYVRERIETIKKRG